MIEHLSETSANTLQIDLRSDTVTRPTQQMYEAMVTAALGDDGLDGDPTVRDLERYTAELLGKESGVYMPSATMANLTAVMALTQRQDLVLAHESSHIYGAERGGAALSGTFYQPIRGDRGSLDLTDLEVALASNRSKLRTTLVCMETSHNSAGGAVPSLQHMERVAFLAHGRGASLHLDGARLFNAAAYLNVPAASIAAHADTACICLSKGLSAPMGAVLTGTQSVIDKARALRRHLGGSQRQAGIAASAGLIALQTMVGRLKEDHERAATLSIGLGKIASLKVSNPQTNIVQVDVSETGNDAQAWERRLLTRGVLVRPWGKNLLRCVTHRHIDNDAVERAIAAFVAEANLSS
ncbi:MAG TPA: GntG family PLP-dependent aldolase [Burkholderiaceae bacterium]|nr:GntG family PLP-dependent aldolase [Burkholderiaceae bacterium]